MEHNLVGCFNLVVGLALLNESEVVLNFVAGKEASELLVNKLGSVVSYHRVKYSEMCENVPPDELPSLGGSDGG